MAPFAMRLPLFFVAVLCLKAADPGSLNLQNLTFQEYEDGPPLARAHVYHAGETLFLSFRVAGYGTFVDTDEVKHLKLNWTLEMRDPKGRLLAPAESGKVDTALDQEDKKWMPKIRYFVEIPPQAGTGTYKLNLLLDDEYSKAQIKQALDIPVKGYDLEPADQLTVRNLKFFRSEEDREPLAANSAFRPGDSVWLRFEMIGFQLSGPKNQYSVSYGVSMMDATGKSLFSAPNAAADAQESFYPKRFVPASLSLNLDKNIKPGTYTVVITAADPIGKTTAEQRAQFNVE